MISITSMVNNMNGYFQLKRSEESLVKASQQLSSYQFLNKVNNAYSGVDISSKASSGVRENNQSLQNANNAISLTQVADSAVGNASDILLRIKELAIQAGNGTLSDDNKASIETEINELSTQLSDIGKNTTFNGINVFDNSQSLTIQIGFNQSISLDLSELSNLTSTDENSTSGATSSSDLLKNIDNVLSQMSDTRSRLSTTQSKFSEAIENFSSQVFQTMKSNTQINDSEYAQSISEFLQAKLSKQANASTFLKSQDTDRAFLNSLLGNN